MQNLHLASADGQWVLAEQKLRISGVDWVEDVHRVINDFEF